MEHLEEVDTTSRRSSQLARIERSVISRKFAEMLKNAAIQIVVETKRSRVLKLKALHLEMTKTVLFFLFADFTETVSFLCSYNAQAI
jgi:hypothetical protein